MQRLLWVAGLVASAALASGASKREIAITLDDLPAAQSGTRGCEFGSLQMQTLRLITVFLHQRAPLTAFVEPGSCPELAPDQLGAVLKLWLQSGAALGNQTFSGADLNNIDAATYEQEILRAGEALRTLPGGPPRYFRYPLLHAGTSPQTRARIAQFLAAHGYTTAPVTIETLDWMFSLVYSDALSHGKMEAMEHVHQDYLPYMESVVDFFEQRTTEVLGRDIPQILALHANRLNADFAGDVLAMLKRRGYRFISLDEALKDPAYQQPDNYLGPDSLSWIHRWSLAKGLPARAQPAAPGWLQKEYERIRNEE